MFFLITIKNVIVAAYDLAFFSEETNWAWK